MDPHEDEVVIPSLHQGQLLNGDCEVVGLWSLVKSNTIVEFLLGLGQVEDWEGRGLFLFGGAGVKKWVTSLVGWLSEAPSVTTHVLV